MDATQLTLHRQGIGGSDIAAICGYSRFRRTAVDVYMEKMGMLLEESETQAQRAGKRLEAAIAEIFAEETGLQTVKPAYPGIYRHPVDTWRQGSPDRFVVLSERETAGLEIKLVGLHDAHAWGRTADGVPYDPLFQSHWYLDVFGFDRWFVVGQIGTESRIYELRRAPDFEAELRARGHEFWFTHVLPKIPPPLDASESYRTYLERIALQRHATYLTATPEIVNRAMTLRDVEQQIDELKERADEMRFAIGQSKAHRNVIYDGIGRWRLDRAVDRAMLGVRSGVEKYIAEHSKEGRDGLARAQKVVVDGLAAHGVTLAMILTKMERKTVEQLSVEDIVLLRADMTALKQNRETVQTLYEQEEGTTEESPKKEDRLAAELAKVRDSGATPAETPPGTAEATPQQTVTPTEPQLPIGGSAKAASAKKREREPGEEG